MIDHLGFPVSNFVRSKAFYEKALAPLSYVLVMEVSADNTEGNAPAAGFGIGASTRCTLLGTPGRTATAFMACSASVGEMDRRTVYRRAIFLPRGARRFAERKRQRTGEH